MTMIKTTEELAAFCEKAAAEDYITVDTEFLSEKSYYAKLCLVQVGLSDAAVCIDPLIEGLDLTPLKKLLCEDKVLKVLHAARSDMAIFLEEFKDLPTPIFDTQVAAMVCGYGESVSYANLVKDIIGVKIDKTNQFTDWSRRPLSEDQIEYALSDVIHLRPCYRKLKDQLEESGRAEWLSEEISDLNDTATYQPDVYTMYEKVKARNPSRKTLQVLKHVTAWRETWAREKNQPRKRVMYDDQLVELAVQTPVEDEEFKKLRAFPKGLMKSRSFPSLKQAIETALNEPEENWPKLPKRSKNNGLDTSAVGDVMKVLLKHVCEQHEVAAKLVASADDIKKLANEENPEIKAMKGWRYKIFGSKAEALKKGEMVIRLDGLDLKIEEPPKK